MRFKWKYGYIYEPEYLDKSDEEERLKEHLRNLREDLHNPRSGIDRKLEGKPYWIGDLPQ